MGLANLAIGIPDLNANVLPGFQIKSLKTMFTATKPFDAVRSISCSMGGSDDYLGAPIDISLSLPDVTAAANRTGTTSFKLSSLFSQVGVTSPDDLPNLAVNAMQLYASKAGDPEFFITLADQPAWTMTLGGTPLTISDVNINLSRSAAKATKSFDQ